VNELSDRIKDVIENEPVALFMKGTPQFVMCGNSDRALRALREAGAPVTAVNILPDPAIRQELSALSGWPTIPQVFVKGELVGGADIVQELSALSGWPTIPQVFVKGELVGGADIVQELSESGELPGMLEEKLGPDYRDAAEEHVVDVLNGARA
jgi:monothiol glutaredoxin